MVEKIFKKWLKRLRNEIGWKGKKIKMGGKIRK